MRGRISWLWLLISTPTRWPVHWPMEIVCKTLETAKRKLNYFTLAVVVRAEAQLYESTTQLRTLPDQLTSYAWTKVSCLVLYFLQLFPHYKKLISTQLFPKLPRHRAALVAAHASGCSFLFPSAEVKEEGKLLRQQDGQVAYLWFCVMSLQLSWQAFPTITDVHLIFLKSMLISVWRIRCCRSCCEAQSCAGERSPKSAVGQSNSSAIGTPTLAFPHPHILFPTHHFDQVITADESDRQHGRSNESLLAGAMAMALAHVNRQQASAATGSKVPPSPFELSRSHILCLTYHRLLL